MSQENIPERNNSSDGVHRMRKGRSSRSYRRNGDVSPANNATHTHTTAAVVGRKRKFRDITSRLRVSESESKRFRHEWDDSDAISESPLKRLRSKASTPSSYYCCMYTTTSLTPAQTLEEDTVEERIESLREVLDNIPKRQRQKAQTIAPMVRECMRLTKWCLDTCAEEQPEERLHTLMDRIIPQELTASEEEARYIRPNRTFLTVSRRPWMDLQFLNEFGACRGDDARGSTAANGSSTIDKRKRRGMYTSFDIALLVDGFGCNRKAAEAFHTVMNTRSRGKIPRLAFGTLLAHRWNLKTYGSVGAVFDGRFAHHVMTSEDQKMVVSPRPTAAAIVCQ